MKELFIQNSSLIGTLNGNRLIYQGKTPDVHPGTVETANLPPSPEVLKKVEATPAKVEKDVTVAKTTAEKTVTPTRSWLNRQLLKFGFTTEAKLDAEAKAEAVKKDLKQSFENAKKEFKQYPDQDTAYRIFAELNAKANEAYAKAEPGTPAKQVFANLADAWGISYDGGAVPALFARRAAVDGIGMPEDMARQTLARLEKGEKVPQKPTEETLLAKAEKISDLQTLLDKSTNKEAMLRAITDQLNKKVDEVAKTDTTGKPEVAFAAFAKNMGIDAPVVWANIAIVPKILRNLKVQDASILDTAIASARKVPAAAPGKAGAEQMVASLRHEPVITDEGEPVIRPASARAKAEAELRMAPKPVEAVAAKPKEMAPNQKELAGLTARIRKELPIDVSKPLLDQLRTLDAAHANPDRFQAIRSLVEELVDDYQVDRNGSHAREAIASLGARAAQSGSEALADKRRGD